MDVYKQIFISGRVQGVFFRDTTRAKAMELRLSGGVRNLHDGRVEVIVSGPENLVQSLIKWLKIGPKHAKVTTIDVLDYTVPADQRHVNGLFEIWPTK